MIRVCIVDDHALVRAGLEQLVNLADDLTVVGCARDGREALHVVAARTPDVVLMDLSMPGFDGVAATRAIAGSVPGARVLVLTSFADRRRIADALGAGAVGYQLKDAEPEALFRSIRAAAATGRADSRRPVAAPSSPV